MDTDSELSTNPNITVAQERPLMSRNLFYRSEDETSDRNSPLIENSMLAPVDISIGLRFDMERRLQDSEYDKQLAQCSESLKFDEESQDLSINVQFTQDQCTESLNITTESLNITEEESQDLNIDVQRQEFESQDLNLDVEDELDITIRRMSDDSIITIPSNTTTSIPNNNDSHVESPIIFESSSELLSPDENDDHDENINNVSVIETKNRRENPQKKTIQIETKNRRENPQKKTIQYDSDSSDDDIFKVESQESKQIESNQSNAGPSSEPSTSRSGVQLRPRDMASEQKHDNSQPQNLEESTDSEDSDIDTPIQGTEWTPRLILETFKSNLRNQMPKDALEALLLMPIDKRCDLLKDMYAKFMVDYSMRPKKPRKPRTTKPKNLNNNEPKGKKKTK